MKTLWQIKNSSSWAVSPSSQCFRLYSINYFHYWDFPYVCFVVEKSSAGDLLHLRKGKNPVKPINHLTSRLGYRTEKVSKQISDYLVTVDTWSFLIILKVGFHQKVLKQPFAYSPLSPQLQISLNACVVENRNHCKTWILVSMLTIISASLYIFLNKPNNWICPYLYNILNRYRIMNAYATMIFRLIWYFKSHICFKKDQVEVSHLKKIFWWNIESIVLNLSFTSMFHLHQGKG